MTATTAPGVAKDIEGAMALVLRSRWWKNQSVRHSRLFRSS